MVTCIVYGIVEGQYYAGAYCSHIGEVEVIFLLVVSLHLWELNGIYFYGYCGNLNTFQRVSVVLALEIVFIFYFWTVTPAVTFVFNL